MVRLICSSAISSVYAAAIAAAAIAADQERAETRRRANRRKEEDFGAAVGVVVPTVEDNLNSTSTMDCLSCEWRVEREAGKTREKRL